MGLAGLLKVEAKWYFDPDNLAKALTSVVYHPLQLTRNYKQVHFIIYTFRMHTFTA